jgi:hypothetical protein
MATWGSDRLRTVVIQNLWQIKLFKSIAMDQTENNVQLETNI